MKIKQLSTFLFSVSIGFFQISPCFAVGESPQTQADSLSIPEFHQVTEQIFRGGRPPITDLAILALQGIHTIVNIDNDLATADAEQTESSRLGLNYINSPMSAFTAPSDQQVEELLAHLQNEANFPIFIHCQHGQDRTGLIIGLYRFRVDHWSAQMAYNEMLKFNFHPILWALDSYYKTKTRLPEL